MALKNQNPPKRKGRPPGSKTRPDAPSKLKQAQAHGGIVQPSRSPRPSEIKTPMNNEVIPATATATETKSDTEIFGGIKPATDPVVNQGTDSVIPDSPVNPGATDQAQPGNPGDAGSGTDESESKPPPEPKTDDAEAQRPLVSLCIDATLNTLAAAIGPFWYPRPVGTAPGMVSYDERDRLVKSGCRWFASMAIEALTPAQEFAMECFNYSLPRMKETFEWIKTNFFKKKKKEEKTQGETVDIKTTKV
jgi:hypothetical protein